MLWYALFVEKSPPNNPHKQPEFPTLSGNASLKAAFANSVHLASNLAAVEGDPKQVTPIPSMGRNLYLPTYISLIFYGFDVDKLYRSHGFYGFVSYIAFVCFFGGGTLK